MGLDGNLHWNFHFPMGNCQSPFGASGESSVNRGGLTNETHGFDELMMEAFSQWQIHQKLEDEGFRLRFFRDDFGHFPKGHDGDKSK